MISGTIYNAGKMLELTQKWEQKKNSGNIVKRQEKELTKSSLEKSIQTLRTILDKGPTRLQKSQISRGFLFGLRAT